MPIDAATAKALFAIIMVSTRGADLLKLEEPLRVEDRGDSWLVKGTPYAMRNSQHCMTHIFFRKDTAEVSGILSEARMIPSDVEKAQWKALMPPAKFDRIFGPPARFEPRGVGDIYLAVYGGLINTPFDATAYAEALLPTTSPNAEIDAIELEATESGGVWHISTKPRDGAPRRELLRFSRRNGKVLSGL